MKSFFVFASEHQELMHQIESTPDHKKRQVLKTELEGLVSKMEEKGEQITKLRKHQQMVSENMTCVICCLIASQVVCM